MFTTFDTLGEECIVSTWRATKEASCEMEIQTEPAPANEQQTQTRRSALSNDYLTKSGVHKNIDVNTDPPAEVVQRLRSEMMQDPNAKQIEEGKLLDFLRTITPVLETELRLTEKTTAFEGL